MINQSRKSKRRPGFTLIELLIVITLTGVILSMAVTVTSRCFKHASNNDRWNHFVGTIHHLGEDFREDVNAADQLLELTETTVRLSTVQLSNRPETIVYEIKENAIVQQTIVDEKTVSTESYPLAGCEAKFIRKSDSLISIQIRSDATSNRSFSLNIDAGLYNPVASEYNTSEKKTSEKGEQE
ncbi:MAG: hypothetical protein COA78_24600 [Blastopirellula sp.]|nr:MAG: hypothetical protein COA78_24600 [Blastopirellula sp.]